MYTQPKAIKTFYTIDIKAKEPYLDLMHWCEIRTIPCWCPEHSRTSRSRWIARPRPVRSHDLVYSIVAVPRTDSNGRPPTFRDHWNMSIIQNQLNIPEIYIFITLRHLFFIINQPIISNNWHLLLFFCN